VRAKAASQALFIGGCAPFILPTFHLFMSVLACAHESVAVARIPSDHRKSQRSQNYLAHDTHPRCSVGILGVSVVRVNRKGSRRRVGFALQISRCTINAPAAVRTLRASLTRIDQVNPRHANKDSRPDPRELRDRRGKTRDTRLQLAGLTRRRPEALAEVIVTCGLSPDLISLRRWPAPGSIWWHASSSEVN